MRATLSFPGGAVELGDQVPDSHPDDRTPTTMLVDVLLQRAGRLIEAAKTAPAAERACLVRDLFTCVENVRDAMA